MITKVVHGWRPAGLLAYLLGPGTAEVHRSPRVIATWDGLDTAWQPERTGPGEYDLRLKPLADALQAPAVAADLPTRAPAEDGRRGYVWHCSARLAAADRVLSDGEWAAIARELLDGAGIAACDDRGGPRWVAVRHADDHIHIAAVLVRQDTGRRFWPHHDYPKLRETARRIERRLGVTITAAADRTAPPRPQRGELEKADRQGRKLARPELRRAARLAAIRASGPDEFVAELRRMGYLAELRRAPSGDPLGYKVARRGDRTAAGRPVFYSGSKLAPDLSLPQLARRWSHVEDAAGEQVPLDRAEDVVRRARTALTAPAEMENVDGVIHATSDVLTALGDLTGQDGARWRRAAEEFDRAARPPRGRVPEPGPVGVELRSLARGLLSVRGGRARDAVGSAAFVVAVAGLLQEIAAWQHLRGRPHQGDAALAASALVPGRPRSRGAGNAGERDAAARSESSRTPQRAQKGEMRMPHRPTAPEP